MSKVPTHANTVNDLIKMLSAVKDKNQKIKLKVMVNNSFEAVAVGEIYVEQFEGAIDIYADANENESGG